MGISDIINEQARKMMELIQSEEEKAIKDLISIAGINPDKVTAENIEECRNELKDRGYTIEVQLENGDSVYRLYRGTEFVTGVAVRQTTEYDLENGKATTKIKRELVKTENPMDILLKQQPTGKTIGFMKYSQKDEAPE